MKTLFGKNIYLRSLLESDVNDSYYSWMNDKIINAYMETRFTHHSIDDIKKFVVNADCNSFIFVICDRATDKHIGNIKLGPINSYHKKADVSFFIGDMEFWGRGLAKEAISLVVHYGFNELGLHKICAGVYDRNIGSLRALEKVGFVIEGIKKAECFCDSSWVDVYILGLINDK